MTRFPVQLCEWRNHAALFLGEEADGQAARIIILVPSQLVPANEVYLIEREESA